jgi:hypothetical protein
MVYAINSENKCAEEVYTKAEIDNKMGTTDISSLGDGTVTGVLSTLNSNIGTKLSNTDIKISSKTYTITSFTEWWGNVYLGDIL